MSRQIDELLAKQMDRRDFIKHLGIGMLALFGMGAIVKMLSPVESKTAVTSAGSAGASSSSGTSAQTATQSLAYGGGAYGGRRSN